MNISNLFSS